MGLIERVFGRSAAAPGGAPAMTAAGPAPSTPTTLPYLSPRTAAGVNAVWRCVTLIGDSIADMPWTEWRGDTQLQPSRLVQRPYANMTRREWTWRVVAIEALQSTCYLLHTGGYDSAGTPWSLMPLSKDVVWPLDPDPWGLIPATEYAVGGMKVSASELTILRRFPWPTVSDEMAGVLDIARTQLSGILAADYHAARYWASGGPPSAVLTSDQELTDPQAELARERWRTARQRGTDYPAVLGKGLHAEPWGANPTEQSAVEARREIVADVGRYFGVPTRILNAPAGDSETYSNVEQDAIDLHRYTLRGYAGPIEDAISENLPGGYLSGRRMRLDPAAFLQGTLPERATAYQLLTTGDRPILTVPEARVRGFGLPPTPATELAEPAASDTLTISAPTIG